ncbi:MAG: permease [Dehalococcoidia bacterium]|nr:permease [Dehalococcoidia bacterium]
MKNESRQGTKGSSTRRGGLIFFGIVAAIYALVLVVFPSTGKEALALTLAVLKALIVPLSLVFAALVLTNLFLKPKQVSALIGKDSGLKGSLLSLLAGIASVGPAYAWYPLLGTVHKHGGGAGQISVFLFGRAIKPFLLPAMIAYFGWVFSLSITLLTAIGALILGWTMNRIRGTTA